MSLSRAVFTARTASRVMLKNNIVARASTAKFSSYFKFPPIPEDGVYRRPTIAPPTRPLHEESDNFLFDGQAPEPVLDTFSDINRWTALRHLLLALTVFTSPLWLQKLLLDEHETPAIMPLADKEEFNTSNPMPSRQARVFHV